MNCLLHLNGGRNNSQKMFEETFYEYSHERLFLKVVLDNRDLTVPHESSGRHGFNLIFCEVFRRLVFVSRLFSCSGFSSRNVILIKFDEHILIIIFIQR